MSDATWPRLAVMLSGRGSNFLAILRAVESGALPATAALCLSDRAAAAGLDLARERGIPAVHLSPKSFPDEPTYSRAFLDLLAEHGIDRIALAGYLKPVPGAVVAAYHGRIVNIHPSLLPSFGGAGMYGHHVHEAVLARGCKVSGATVHLVTERYDEGPILAQRCVPVQPDDTAETLAARVLAVEHALYPETIRTWLASPNPDLT